jgi:hypothetical protein
VITPSSLFNSTTSLEQAQLKAPYGNTQLYLAAIFLGVIGVGLVAAVNWRRLRKPRRIVWVIALCVVTLLLSDLLYAAIIYQLAIQSNIPPAMARGGRTGLLIFLSFSVLFAIIAERLQGKPYREWVAAHGDTAPTFRDRGGWVDLGLIILASLVLWAVYAASVSPIIWNAVTQPAASTVFSDPAFDLTYSGRWYATNPAQFEPAACEQVECVLLLTRFEGEDGILIARRSGFFDRNASLETWAPAFLNGVVQGGGIEFAQTPTAVVLDGQKAQQAVFTLTTPQGPFRQTTLVTKQSDGAFLVIVATTTEDASPETQAEIEAIISSIQFR